MRWMILVLFLLPGVVFAQGRKVEEQDEKRPDLREIIAMLSSDDAGERAKAKRMLDEMKDGRPMVLTHSFGDVDIFWRGRMAIADQDKLLETLLAQLEAGEIENAKEVAKWLRKEIADARGALAVAPFGDGVAGVPAGVSVTVSPDSGGEIMSGAVDLDGEVVRYRLTSLGKGRYNLSATTTGRDGNTKKTVDAGTMAELQRKYRYLASLTLVGMPRTRTPTTPLRGRIIERSDQRIAVLGISVARPCEELRWHFYIPPGVGYLVRRVESGSVAERVGIEPNDILMGIDGRRIEKIADLLSLARGRGSLVLIRRAEEKSIPFGADGK